MKTKLLACFLLLTGSLIAADFQLEEKAFTIGTDLEIVGTSGVIEERTLSIGQHFEIVNSSYNCESKEELFAWGTTYEIKVAGQTKYVVQKQVMESMFTFMGNVYIIKDNKGNELARSELSKGLRPTIIVREKNGAASVLRASGWNYYTWDIHQDDKSQLDPRVLFIICAAKATGDNEKK